MKTLAMLTASLIFVTHVWAQEAKPSEKPAALVVDVKTVEAQPVLQKRFMAKREEIAAKLGPANGQIIGQITVSKGEMTMMPMSRYFAEKDGALDMAAAIAVKKPVTGKGDIESSELPAGLVATTIHMGPYEKLPETYAALQAWIKEKGHEAGDQSWEIYWTDPGTEADPKKWKTEVVQVLKK